ncbi:hypothetical protein H0E87_023554 [Populus deltoides]|uniref:Uncharacterized protein n=1 Tax=Populus deltoides TaxID=3696 RepID=A0A8T2XFM2_POPDE|nr:hypothetical protein H0E87_023554 [Populus deltoides]
MEALMGVEGKPPIACFSVVPRLLRFPHSFGYNDFGADSHGPTTERQCPAIVLIIRSSLMRTFDGYELTGVTRVDPLSTFWSTSDDGADVETERRGSGRVEGEVMIFLARLLQQRFITTPLCSNRLTAGHGKAGHGVGIGIRDSIYCRFHLLSEGQGSCELQQLNTKPTSSGDFSGLGPIVEWFCYELSSAGKAWQAIGSVSHMRHVTCVEDAAIFCQRAAAVDLSIVACRPFREKLRKEGRHSL